jgi:hypothetical protein
LKFFAIPSMVMIEIITIALRRSLKSGGEKKYIILGNI